MEVEDEIVELRSLEALLWQRISGIRDSCDDYSGEYLVAFYKSLLELVDGRIGVARIRQVRF